MEEKNNDTKINKLKAAISGLPKRLELAINETDDFNIKGFLKNKKRFRIIIGSGGSNIPALFLEKMLESNLGFHTKTMYPKEYLETNKTKIRDNLDIFCFSYSGTSPEIIEIIKDGQFDNLYLITKAEEKDLIERFKDKYNLNISKIQIISYNNTSTKERGFLSIEGIIVPAVLIYMDLLNLGKEETLKEFYDKSTYVNNFLKEMFENKKTSLNKGFKIKNTIELFYDSYSKVAAMDLESKIVESGTYRIALHEKKNFSHGRFISLENYKSDIQIYFKNKNTTTYDKQLLDYLKIASSELIVFESRFEGIEATLEHLIFSQYLIFYVSELLKKDLSNPEYSDESMKIFRYNKKLT